MTGDIGVTAPRLGWGGAQPTQIPQICAEKLMINYQNKQF